MWDWDRSIVRPLAIAAFSRSMREQRDECRRSRETSSEEEQEWRARLDLGEHALHRYFEWAPSVDGFVPIRVDTEYDVPIPDPDRPGADLVAPNGDPVHFRGRIDVLVEDRDGGHWVLAHRIDPPARAQIDRLPFDEVGVTDCWAWENFFLGMRIAGNIVNELCSLPADARFRRTHVRRSAFDLAEAGARLGLEVREMINPDARTDPNPSPENCGRCDFVPPCLALYEGSDARAILKESYRRRRREPEEPRIGRSQWAMSRGATLPKHPGDGSS